MRWPVWLESPISDVGARTVLVALVGAVLAYLVLNPLLLLLISSFRPTGMPADPGFTFSHYLTTFSNRETYQLLWNSLTLAAGTVVLTSILGLSFAWLLERTDTPGAPLLRVLLVTSMATPPIMLAMSWVLLLSPKIGFLNNAAVSLFGLEGAPLDIYTMPGMIFVQSLSLVPTAFLIFSPAFRNMDPSLEEAAMVSGGGLFDTLRFVVLPVLRPAILASWAYIFIVSMVVFDIPGILGLPTRLMVFSSSVFLAAHPAAGLPQFGSVSASSAVFLILMFAAGFLYLKMTKEAQRFATVTGKGYRPRVLSLGKARYFSLIYVLGYFLLSVLAPFAMLAWTSLQPFYSGVSLEGLSRLTLDNFLTLAQHPKVMSATLNTLVVALVSATAVALFAALVSWAVVRSRVRGARVLDMLAFLPIAIPAVMTGLALLYVYITFRFIPIYGTIWIIALAYITVYIPFGTRTINGVLTQIHNELEEASYLSGASWLQTLRRIILPLVFPALISVWIWVAAHAMRELSAALMLASGTNVMLSTLLWGFWDTGMMPTAAAVGVAVTLALVALVSVGQVLSKWVKVGLP